MKFILIILLVWCLYKGIKTNIDRYIVYRFLQEEENISYLQGFLEMCKKEKNGGEYFKNINLKTVEDYCNLPKRKKELVDYAIIVIVKANMWGNINGDE